MHFSIDRTVHTTAFDKPVVDHWLERKIAQTAAGSTEKDRSDDRPLQRRARYRLSYIPLPLNIKSTTRSEKGETRNEWCTKLTVDVCYRLIQHNAAMQISMIVPMTRNAIPYAGINSERHKEQ